MNDSPADLSVLESGLVVPVYKPLSWTSFQAVKRLKFIVFRALNKKVKVGHAGTLDPLADGLLLICVGRATRKIVDFQDMMKEYTGTIRLGATTPSFDLETEVDQEFPWNHITRSQTEEAIQTLSGHVMQHPPAYSARWIDGQRAYTLARAGEVPRIQSRPAYIESFEITRFELPEIDFKIRCGKGTYIRSLARDLGVALQSGGHLTKLTRTAIGDFTSAEAFHAKTITLEEILSGQPL